VFLSTNLRPVVYTLNVVDAKCAFSGDKRGVFSLNTVGFMLHMFL